MDWHVLWSVAALADLEPYVKNKYGFVLRLKTNGNLTRLRICCKTRWVS